MAAIDGLNGVGPGRDSPADSADEVTPSNSTDLTYITRGVYVGTGGDLTVTMKGGQDVVFANIPDGTILPIRVSRIKATGTTATDIVAMW